MRRVWAAMAVATALAACGGAGSGGATAGSGEQVVVLAAASLTDVFGQLAAAYEAAHPKLQVTTSFGASSALREQILEGAPADVYASAGPGPMEDLERAGEVRSPTVFATNRLLLAVPAGNPAGVTGLADLARPELLVGLCASEAPCGALADAVLARARVEAAPDTREPDVRAVLTKLGTGELDAGLVYATDVRAADGDVEGIDLPAELPATTSYPIAALAGSGPAATGLVDFVLGPRGREILRAHGFGVP